MPPPQTTLHEPHAPNAETTQSTGQELVLQSCSWLVVGQARPPFCAATMIERVWLCLPPPQLLLQADQADQPEIWQSMGQGWVLH